MSALPPRETIAQRYRLIAQIGKGGMGAVWRAEHLSLRTPLAIKLLDPKLASDAVLRARFLREAQAAATLKSAHVVQILDHGVDDDLPYIAMELLDGESLRARLFRKKRLEASEVAALMPGVLRAVARAHKAGIVHRDLKPDNIFIVVDDDQGEVVKVLDFGIAKLLDDAHAIDGSGLTDGEGGGVGGAVSTATGTMLGTPYYMSPEQLRGRKEIDARADLWAIGVIVYECLIGRRPFVADAIGELVLTICASPPPVPSEHGTVPAGFDAWFAKAVALDPNARFQTAQELAAALSEVLADGARWLPSELDTSTPAGRARASKVPLELALAPTEVAPSPVPEAADTAAGQSLSRDTQRAPKRGWYLTASALAVLGLVAVVLYVVQPSFLAPSSPSTGATTPSTASLPSPNEVAAPTSVASGPAPGTTSGLDAASAAPAASSVDTTAVSATSPASAASAASTVGAPRATPRASSKPSAAPAASPASPTPTRAPNIPADPG